MKKEPETVNFLAAIKERISHRSYSAKPLSKGHRFLLESLMGSTDDNPFSIPVNFSLIEHRIGRHKRLGTYGIIRGAGTFIAGTVTSTGNDYGMEAFGYCMERIVLTAQDSGLGTCWLGGTFSRGGFSKALNLQKGDLLPCITPVGYARNKKTMMERLMRSKARSSKRKPWSEIFFLNSFNEPFTDENAGEYTEVLKAVRLAPSASNKQPWRIVIDRETGCCHFYLYTSTAYVGNKLGFRIQRIDMGIAMFHFGAAASQLGLQGNWKFEDPGLFTPLFPNGTITYTATWCPNDGQAIPDLGAG